MEFFSIHHIAFTLFGYPVSYTELIGTVSGLGAVYLASRANVLTWPVSIINGIFFFILFYQVQLYPDMFLQVYFLAVAIYGWFNWGKKRNDAHPISYMQVQARWYAVVMIALGNVLLGFLFSRIHEYLPEYFPRPAAYPYADSFVMAGSIVASVLLARKKIENWILWMVLDLVCILLYYKKDIYFMSLEYFVFLCISTYGFFHWIKKSR